MRSFQRRFRRVSAIASSAIGHSRFRLAAIDAVLCMTRADDPTIEPLVLFHAPHPDIGRIRVNYRGAEAEILRGRLRSLARY